MLARLEGAPCICWAMGITQHRNAVATIKEFVNLALLQGNIGKPGAGPVPGARPLQRAGRPHHGHLGAAARRTSSTRSRDEFGFEPPREHGFDTVDAIRALRDGEAQVFIGLGGNFVSAAPDTDVTEEALRQRRAHRAGLDQAQPLARRRAARRR